MRCPFVLRKFDSLLRISNLGKNDGVLAPPLLHPWTCCQGQLKFVFFKVKIVVGTM